MSAAGTKSPQERYRRDAKHLGKPWYRLTAPGMWVGGGGSGSSGAGCDGDD